MGTCVPGAFWGLMSSAKWITTNEPLWSGPSMGNVLPRSVDPVSGLGSVSLQYFSSIAKLLSPCRPRCRFCEAGVGVCPPPSTIRSLRAEYMCLLTPLAVLYGFLLTRQVGLLGSICCTGPSWLLGNFGISVCVADWYTLQAGSSYAGGCGIADGDSCVGQPPLRRWWVCKRLEHSPLVPWGMAL